MRYRLIRALLCDAILNYKISAHLHNLFMAFPQFKVPNGASMRNAILRKLITVKTYFLQLRVPDTLLSANSYFGICLNRSNFL